MRKKAIRIMICCVCIIALAGCVAENTTEETTQPHSAQATQIVTTTESFLPTQVANITTSEATTQAETIITENAVTEDFSEMAETITPVAPPTVQSEPESEESTTVSTTKTIEKTGEMAFSDDVSNRYIAAVSQKYNVDAQTLVALYTVPENDSNIVLEFDGSKDANGNLVRNKDTLIAIYSIDKELNSKRASEDRSLNEYSYSEMKVMFFTTTNHIMPEFEELK